MAVKLSITEREKDCSLDSFIKLREQSIFDWSSEDTIQNDTKEKWEKGGYAGFQRNSIEEKCLLAKQNEEIHAVKETDIWNEETRYK